MATLDKGVTLRPASTSLLTIDSEDRFLNYDDERLETNTRSPYNFRLANNKSLMTGFFTRLAIQQVVFPWTVPNINYKTSKIGVSYNSGGGRVDIILDFIDYVGFYTPVQLATLIQVAVRAVDASLAAFTITYGSYSTGTTQITLPVFEYKSNNATAVGFYPIPYNSSNYPFPNTTKQLFDIMGFTAFNAAVTSGTNKGNISFAQAIRFIDIVSPDLVQCASLHDGTSLNVGRDSLCRLYVEDIDSTNIKGVALNDAKYAPAGTQPGVINYLPPIAKQIAWRANQNIGSSVRFQIYDDNGDLLDESTPFYSSDNSNWSMSLLVTEN